MKTKLKMMTVLLWMAGVFYSCSKNMEIEPMTMSSKQSGFATHSILIDGPGNTENELDSIGIWHNRMLDYIVANRPDENSPLSEPEIKGLLNEFSLLHWGQMLPDSPISKTNWWETDGIHAYLDELVARSALSEYGRQNLNHLLLVVNEQVSHPDFSYSTFKTIIKEMEMSFKTDNLLTYEDKQILQMAASVARHSTWYWTEGNCSDPEPGHNYDTGRITLKGIIRTVATISADIGGAAGGYVGGSLTGAAGKAAGDSEWMYNYISYGIPGN